MNFDPVTRPPSNRGFQVVAIFSVDFTDDLRIFNWQLVLCPDGRFTVYPPAGKIQSSIIAVSPTTRNKIAAIASEILHDSIERAA
ncbi:hypothetical protein ECB98_13425 [Brucellaceae bacterium VT-16-1752]|nr:hypothetical protein ECB98_13425 [Brucellaceae bacterium VT-16-1752]